MQLYLPLLVALLLCLEGCAIYGPEFKPSSPGFHKRHQRKLKDSSGFKLPGTARPVKYDLTLTINVNDMTPYMDAEVIITLDVDDDGGDNNKLLLNSEIDFSQLRENQFVWNGNIECTLNATGDGFIEVVCPQSMNGTDQTLKIQYEPDFAREDMNGAYIFRYDENGSTKWMIATQFEQGYARRIMPCFDEPEYKAPIHLTLRTPKDANIDFSDWVANTKVESASQDGNMISTTFSPTSNMSTYLLAFVATHDFKNFTSTSTAYEFEVFARPSYENYVSTALKIGPKTIDLMGNFTGIPYTSLGNNKMTLAAIPEFEAGAMENWGLITFREEVLIDEGSNKTARKDLQYIIEVIAHEVTHQWFGDYITTDWWSETWLNEGFAEYFEYYLTDKIFSDFEMMHQLVIKEQQQAMRTDAYPDTMPLSNNASNVTTSNDFSNEFGDISYAKGSSMVRMIRHTVGDEVFQGALQTYLKNNEYGNPTAEILINSFQTALPNNTNLNLTTILHAWIYEPGYPILDVSLDKNNLVSIKSTKFSSSLNKTVETNSANWWIPLTYTTSANPNFDAIHYQWIDPEKVSNFSAKLPEGNDSWIMFNLQSAGYYRVNYDEILWNRILNVLNNSETFSTIHVLNRAQLLDDAFIIARSREGNETDLKKYYIRAFKLAQYLKHEPEYHPWFTFFREMQYLMEKIQDEDTLSTLKETILEIVSPQVIIPQTHENLSHTEILKRNLLLSWACRVGHKNCTQWASEQFQSYKTGTESIDNNYRDIIVCTGLAHSSHLESDFEHILSLLKNSILPLEGKTMAMALTCINGELWVNKTLQQTVNYVQPPFPRMFFDKLMGGFISDGSEKVSAAIKFVLTYDYSIAQYWHNIEDPETLLRTVATKINSQDQIDLILRYIQQYQNDSDHTSMISAAKSAVDSANNNMEWLKKYGNILTSVIMYDGGDPPPSTTTTTEVPTEAPSSTDKLGYNIVLITAILSILKMLF